MREIHFEFADGPEPVGQYLAEVIANKLATGQRVLWLVPGGSAIAAALAASGGLGGVPLANLSVSLTDERFGPVGYPDSNWQQLRDAEFELPGATLKPVLNGADQEQTVKAWAAWLQQALDAADFSIGLFGIGTDGHTAGVLPGSTAVNSSDFAVGYQSDPFYRITMTPAAIAKLDEAVVMALNADKRPQLERLKTDLPLSEQPAQALKRVPKLILYNSQQ